MTPLPTLRQLQFFLALVRRQSFSKAAEDCLVSQSTLSAAIKEMEGLLNQQLVDRTTRSFALTPAGRETAERAAPLLAAAEDLVRAARERGPLEGPFNLGVIPTIAPFMVPQAARRLQKKFPLLKLYLREELTGSLIERLSAGLIDAALMAFPFDVPGAEIMEIGEDPFWFACGPDHEFAKRRQISTDDLNTCELFLLEDGHCLRDHAINACNLGLHTGAGAFGATSLFTLTQMSRSGLGATLLPEMAVRAGMAKGAGLIAIPLKKPRPSRTIGVAWRKGSGRTDEARAVAEIFQEVLVNSEHPIKSHSP